MTMTKRVAGSAGGSPEGSFFSLGGFWGFWALLVTPLAMVTVCGGMEGDRRLF
jgi:hypothetical protein